MTHVIAIGFVDLRDELTRVMVIHDPFGSAFALSVARGGTDCLICSKALRWHGEHTATVYGRFECTDQENEPVMVNVGCCLKCFKKHESFADAAWDMGERIRRCLS